MSTTRAAVLATVERSWAAAAEHDRRDWVGAFAEGARIEYPIGSRPHIGREQIERFYDTFIGPRAITFRRDVDIVRGHSVLRDLVLEVRMGRAVTLQIPAVLRYDVQPVAGDLKIVRLQAFWELPAMAWRFARNGPVAMPAAAQLARGLLRNQGLAGAAGFLAGLTGVGEPGKRCVAQVIDDACAGDEMAVKRRLGPDVYITAGDSDRLPRSELVATLSGARQHTMIAAGRHVAVSVTGPGPAAVLIADVASRPAQVRRLRVFVDEG